ncbi:uncharacterized protein [Palaemon carinicauda]|uniref:uncharacterized protein n=1 Tax=Palaemon carinicauda TaxID=392227 RepID=UPI0035B5801B
MKISRQRHKIVAIVSANVGKGINTPGYTSIVHTLEANGIRLADQRPNDNAAGIEIILGADYLPRLLKRTHNIQGVNLFCTPTGYMVWGELPDWSRPDMDPRNVSAVTITINRIDVDSPMTINPPLENLWKLDTIGITKEPFSHLEEKAVDHFKGTTQYKTRKYVMQVPFKCNKHPASNYARAFAQLMSVKKSKNSQLFTDYRNILDEYLEENIFEPVPLGTPVDGKVHYLPHRPIVKNSATTSIRIVFNASSRSNPNSLSLNDSLYTEPNLASKIQSMILMFREKPFGLTADISKAFLRIEIVSEQRDFCRFLFLEDLEMKRIVAYQFKVVLFGATSSPYLLNQTIQHHLDSQSSRLGLTLKTSFYVDNFQRCYVDPKDILSERPLIEALMLKANMPLAKWTLMPLLTAISQKEAFMITSVLNGIVTMIP